MHLPDWRTLTFVDGVQWEPTPDAARLVLWTINPKDKSHWNRVSSLSGARVDCSDNVCRIAANLVPTETRSRSFLTSFLRLFRKCPEGATWFMPGGAMARQCGERRTDVLLVWSADERHTLDAPAIAALWPSSEKVVQLATSLFVVIGVTTLKEDHILPALPPKTEPCPLARRLLAEARQRGDPSGIAAALIDMSVVVQRENNPIRVAELLEEALGLNRSLGNRAQEMDVLGNLGTAYLAMGKTGPALEVFWAEHAIASELGSKFADKVALGHLGQAHASLGNAARTIGFFEQALEIARQLGDRQGQADLHWDFAIQHAELGQRQQALACGQAAVAFLEQMGKPSVRTYAEYLEEYRHGSMSERLAPVAGEYSYEAAGSTSASPRLLKMAISVAKSMAKYVGSGLATVTAEIYYRRVKTCAGCEHHTGVRCRVCGCFTQIKARLPHENCPLEKWPT